MNLREVLWTVLLGTASLLSSYVFACATPFAALAALAALHLRSRPAFLLISVTWLANQLCGYCVLNYPQTWSSFAWGGTIGLAALMALPVASFAAKLLHGTGVTAATVGAFLAAFAGYEAVLYAATAILPSGPSAFSLAVIVYLFAINGLAMTGLLALRRLGVAAGLILPRVQPATGTA